MPGSSRMRPDRGAFRPRCPDGGAGPAPEAVVAGEAGRPGRIAPRRAAGTPSGTAAAGGAGMPCPTATEAEPVAADRTGATGPDRAVERAATA